MAKKVEQAPNGTGAIFTLDNGTVLQVLIWGNAIQVTNISRSGPNTSGLSVRALASNKISVSEAR